MSDALVMADKSGRELAAGDLIVYGHALGRCAGLQYGKVLGLQRAKPRWSSDTEAELAVRVRVQGVDWDWSDFRPPALLKPSVLQFGERILKIHPAQVHPKVLELLDKVEVA